MAEEWSSALKREVEPLLVKMDAGVDTVVECTQGGDLSGAWEAMQELGQNGRQMHEAMQPYVTGEVAAEMPAATYEALSDVCWASHSWFTAVQEVEAVVSDAEMTGQGFETPELTEQIDTCVTTWRESRAKLVEAGRSAEASIAVVAARAGDRLPSAARRPGSLGGRRRS